MARPHHIARNEKHHRAKYPDAAVNRARLLHKRGYGAKDTMLLLSEEGIRVPYDTVVYWLKERGRI